MDWTQETPALSGHIRPDSPIGKAETDRAAFPAAELCRTVVDRKRTWPTVALLNDPNSVDIGRATIRECDHDGD
jgi:hypothetical protein